MKLWQKYINERLGAMCLETEHAFITFAMHEERGVIVILDVFVDPDHRESNKGMQLYFQLESYAEDYGIKEIQGTLHVGTPMFDRILKLALKQEFKITQAHENALHVSKKVGV
jgi:hypothetical protein